MIPLAVLSMVLVGAFGLATAITREPLRQLVTFTLFGFALSVFFLVVQAPDVALSYIVVSGVYPVLILLTLAKARARNEAGRGER